MPQDYTRNGQRLIYVDSPKELKNTCHVLIPEDVYRDTRKKLADFRNDSRDLFDQFVSSIIEVTDFSHQVKSAAKKHEISCNEETLCVLFDWKNHGYNHYHAPGAEDIMVEDGVGRPVLRSFFRSAAQKLEAFLDAHSDMVPLLKRALAEPTGYDVSMRGETLCTVFCRALKDVGLAKYNGALTLEAQYVAPAWLREHRL